MSNRDRGAALVEFAFIIGFLLMIAIGAFEWGMGFRDQLSVSQGVREAARVGAASGDYYLNTNNNADCVIIEAAAGALKAIGGNDVREIWIYEADDVGTILGPKQRFRPKVAADNPATLTCNGGWFPIEQTWNPPVRDNQGAVRDWLGVRVVLDHEWKTNFLWWNGTVQWQESVVFHLEPGVVN